jgi:hypothetical protein
MNDTGHSDQTRSQKIGVAVATVRVTNTHTDVDTLIIHSCPPGGNSSHIDPDVWGMFHQPRMFPSVGAIVYDGVDTFDASDAGADGSCGRGVTAVPPVGEFAVLASFTVTALFAAAVVAPMENRMPVMLSRRVDGVVTSRIGWSAVVTEIDCEADDAT